MKQPQLLWMDITDAVAQYPSNGIGGITTSAAAALYYHSLQPMTFRFLGVIVVASDVNANLVTLTKGDATTHTYTLPASSTVGAFWPVPEFVGLTPTTANGALGNGKNAKVNLDGGIACGHTFTLTQAQAGWDLRGVFVADVG